jgi:hypothetical protein
VSQTNNSIYYPILALSVLIFAIILIPRAEFKKWFWFSLFWGSGVDAILILLIKLLNLYHYIKAEPFSFYGSPMFINLSWVPVILMFIHFLPNRSEKYILYLYIAAFSFIGLYVGIILHSVGLIVETHWHELLRFPLWYGWFYGAYRHYKYLEKTHSKRSNV